LWSDFSSNYINSFADLSTFYITLFLILFALLPNLNVDRVSLALYSDIEPVITKHVYALPPRDSYKIYVNFESL